MHASLVVLERLAWMNRISDTHHDARTQKLHAANSRGRAFEIRIPSRFERLTQNETHDPSRGATISLARIHVEQYITIYRLTSLRDSTKRTEIQRSSVRRSRSAVGGDGERQESAPHDDVI